MKTVTTILAASACVLSLSAAQAQDKLKIGVIATLSGPPAVLGAAAAQRLPCSPSRTLGGKLGGREVEVDRADDELKPDVAVTKVKALVERDKVDFVVGPIFSNILQAIMKPVTDGGAILISPNAGTSNFAGKDCNPNFFVTSYQNDQVPEVLGKYAQDTGIKKVFLMAPNYQAGQGRARRLQALLQGRDRSTRSTCRSTSSTTRPSSSKIAAAEARRDLRVPAGRHGRELRQAVPPGRPRRQDHVPLRLHGRRSRRCRRSRTRRSASSAARTGRPNLDNPQNKAFVAAFEKEYGAVPATYAFQAYDAALLIDSRPEGDRRQDRQQGGAARRA